jgi:hypothetical protein
MSQIINLSVITLLLFVLSSCSFPGHPKIKVFDEVGLGQHDRSVIVAHARTQREFNTEEFRKLETKYFWMPWKPTRVDVNIEGRPDRIRVWGIYRFGETFGGGPRFEGQKTNDDWIFWPSPINPC